MAMIRNELKISARLGNKIRLSSKAKWSLWNAIKSAGNAAVHVVKRGASMVKSAAGAATHVARIVGGKIVHFTKKAFNAAWNSIKSVGNMISEGLKKLNLIESVKSMADTFFTVTESSTFHKIFVGAVWPIARGLGFGKRHVEAAYKLLTRPFWKLQYWFFKWIFTLGPLNDIRTAGGDKNFAKASKACT